MPPKLDQVNAGNDLRLRDVSDGGFAMVMVDDLDDNCSVLFDEDAIVQMRDFLNEMIKHYNLP